MGISAYADKKKSAVKQAAQTEAAVSGPSLEALRAGAAPSQEQIGHRVDLPDAIRAKMEASFGADLSAVRLYESQTVADAGANAVAQGSSIAFAPGVLDFTSYSGQALLGHEISHVVSQQRGEVSGGGFLNDSMLEARADREGAMAASGQQVYAAPTAAMSNVSATSAAGPMQASKGSKKLVNAEKLTPEMIRGAKLKDLQRQDVQDRVLRDFNAEMSGELQKYNDSSKQVAFSETWRKSAGVGDANRTYNEMLRRLVDPHMSKIEDATGGLTGMERVDQASDMLTAAVEGDKHLTHMITGARGAFQGSVHYANEADQDQMLMSNFMLRAAAPHGTMRSVGETDPQKKKQLVKLSKSLQRGINQNMEGADASKMGTAAEDFEDLSGSRGILNFLGLAGRLRGGGAPAAADTATAQGPVGEGSEETLSYRSPEIAKLANDPRYTPDPTSSDPTQMAVIARRQYDKVKSLQGSGDEAAIREAMESFKAARERMGYN
jgi:hypothetical protein